MNFFHGVSASTGKSYPFPAKYREYLLDEEEMSSSDVEVENNDCDSFPKKIKIKRTRLEGYCGKCNKWINIGTRKLLHYLPNEQPNNPLSLHHLLWFKHCQKCLHKFLPK